jgi:Ca2+-binding RTX toxin-like protein
LAGISGIENVTGSIGNDLIVGDGNANILIGGTGRNIIIGGGGADTLTGGGGDNILIGGTTSYDSDPTQAALARIMKEWLQSSSFADRMSAIENGTDLLAGTGYHFGPDTVFPTGWRTSRAARATTG